MVRVLTRDNTLSAFIVLQLSIPVSTSLLLESPLQRRKQRVAIHLDWSAIFLLLAYVPSSSTRSLRWLWNSLPNLCFQKNEYGNPVLIPGELFVTFGRSVALALGVGIWARPEPYQESAHVAITQSLTACYSAAFFPQSMQHVAEDSAAFVAR